MKTIGHSYWILGGIPYHNEFLSGALKAESTYFQDFYMPTTKVFVGLTTDLVVDGKAIGFAQEFKTAVDGIHPFSALTRNI